MVTVRERFLEKIFSFFDAWDHKSAKRAAVGVLASDLGFGGALLQNIWPPGSTQASGARFNQP